MDRFAQVIQVISVVVGLVVTVRAHADAKESERQTRQLELEKVTAALERDKRLQQIEAAKPFLELRRERYLEALKTAAVLASPELHDAQELGAARKRFRQLYIAELSLVEARSVEQAMVNLARTVDPGLGALQGAELQTYNLAHVVRDSLVKTWGIDDTLVDN